MCLNYNSARQYTQQFDENMMEKYDPITVCECQEN